jgi:hypothetical protein
MSGVFCAKPAGDHNHIHRLPAVPTRFPAGTQGLRQARKGAKFEPIRNPCHIRARLEGLSMIRRILLLATMASIVLAGTLPALADKRPDRLPRKDPSR